MNVKDVKGGNQLANGRLTMVYRKDWKPPEITNCTFLMKVEVILDLDECR